MWSHKKTLNQSAIKQQLKKEGIEVVYPIFDGMKATIYRNTNRLWCHRCRVSLNPIDLVIEYCAVGRLEAAKLILKNFCGGN